MRRLVIVGGGGHGKVVADAAEVCQQWREILFVDDALRPDSRVGPWRVLGSLSDLEKLNRDEFDAAVAVGNNRRRLEIIGDLSASGWRLPAIVHPAAFVSNGVAIGDASVVLAQAAVLVGSCLGIGCIVNTGASVDHDCSLRDGVHLSPGARLAGGVKVGECAWLGMGSSTIGQISIGPDAVVGAGAVVLKDVPAGTTVVGVPAAPASSRDGGE